MRRLVTHIVPLVKATDVLLFLLSGRPFVVLPSLCQSLLVGLSTAKNSLFPLALSPLHNHAIDASCPHMIYQMLSLSYSVNWGAVVVPRLL